MIPYTTTHFWNSREPLGNYKWCIDTISMIGAPRIVPFHVLRMKNRILPLYLMVGHVEILEKHNNGTSWLSFLGFSYKTMSRLKHIILGYIIFLCGSWTMCRSYTTIIVGNAYHFVVSSTKINLWGNHFFIWSFFLKIKIKSTFNHKIIIFY